MGKIEGQHWAMSANGLVDTKKCFQELMMLEIPFKIESASDDYTLELLLCKLVKQTRGF